MRWQAVAVAVAALAVAVAAGGGAASRRALTPRALLNRLLTTQIRAGQLPSNRYEVKIGVSKASDNAKKHHVVGEVEVDIDSGDAGIVYIVFPSRKDALADWYGADLTKATSRLPEPPNLPKPGAILNTSVTGNNAFGKKVTNGATILGFVSQNVIIEAITTSTGNTESGDIPGAISLGRFALRHLSALRVRQGGA